jgi:hypothetical protein
MRKIVDRNYLQSPELRDYLSGKRKNRVVLTDCAAMEAVKGNALQNIVSATEMIREFPRQVVVLKSTNVISTFKGRRCGFTRRMGLPSWRNTARVSTSRAVIMTTVGGERLGTAVGSENVSGKGR